jgi:SAM-dependent methyltransferase
VLLDAGGHGEAKVNLVLEAQARERTDRRRDGLRGVADRLREATTASIFADDRHQVALLAERVREQVGPAPGVVLDVGAAEQYYRRLLEPIGPVVSLDIALYGATDVVGDCQRLPIRSDALAAVFAVEVLEHLPRPWVFFREAARVLRPGGVLAGVAPQYCPTHGFPHDYFRFTREGVESMARDAGLETVALWSIGGSWSTLLRWYWANHARESSLRRVRGVSLAYHAAFQGIAGALDRLDRHAGRGERPLPREHQDHLGWAFVLARPR